MGIFRKKPSVEKLRPQNEIKEICDILFIDDHAFDVVKILITAGWKNTRIIKDIESIEQKELKQAHIVFVDINGVGKKMKFQDEGLGLIKAIKTAYPEKKAVVYSAQADGDRFHPSLSIADASLNKNAEPYEFQTLVENFSKELFTIEQCARRLKEILYEQLGRNEDVDSIVKKMNKLHKSGQWDARSVGQAFNLQHASQAASLISKLVEIYIVANS